MPVAVYLLLLLLLLLLLTACLGCSVWTLFFAPSSRHRLLPRAELPPANGGGDDQARRAAGLDAQEERATGVAAALLLPRAAHLPLLLRVQGRRG